MKKLILAGFMFVAGTCVTMAQSSSAPKTAVKKANVIMHVKGGEEFDFGNIPQGAPATHEFVFENKGKDPLILKGVSSSCGCTTPQWTTTPVKKGATGSITATYNATAEGPFNKTITATYNDAPPKTLSIKGIVVKK